MESEKQELSKVAERYGVRWKQLGTHNKHLSVLDYEKQERAKEGYIHHTAGLTDDDPECDLDYTKGKGVYMPVDVAISNSLGFGGHNATILVKKYLFYPEGSGGYEKYGKSCNW